MEPVIDGERSRQRVVIADDSPDVRAIWRLALERDGAFDVVAAVENGLLALEAAALHQPDLVLIDVTMPLVDGLEASRMIRVACPATTVVVLSVFGASTMRPRALEAGAHGYVEKCGSLMRMLAEVRAHLTVGVS